VPAVLLLLLGGAALLTWRDRTACAACSGGGGSTGARRAGPGHAEATAAQAAAAAQPEQAPQQQQAPAFGGPGLLLSSAPAAGLLAAAPRLLPLTNFSALTTAALLDAHPALASQDARTLVRLHQELYCRCARAAGGAVGAGGALQRRAPAGRPSNWTPRLRRRLPRCSHPPPHPAAAARPVTVPLPPHPGPPRRPPPALPPAPRSGGFADSEPENSQRTMFSNVTMFVYGRDDIVSNSLTGAGRTWESDVSQRGRGRRARGAGSPPASRRRAAAATLAAPAGFLNCARPLNHFLSLLPPRPAGAPPDAVRDEGACPGVPRGAGVAQGVEGAAAPGGARHRR
jgi:hypothetical protein